MIKDEKWFQDEIFFSITIMMLVLLLLFQFSMVLRDRQNTYDTNANLSRRVSDGEEAWSQETSRTSEYFGEKKNIIFIGNAPEHGNGGHEMGNLYQTARQFL